MSECYGQSLRTLGPEVIISSGAIMGSKMLSSSLESSHEFTASRGPSDAKPIGFFALYHRGIDHAFVNWLVYGEKLRQLFKTKIFAMGEGARIA